MKTDIALQFLRAARAGERAVAESLVTPDAKHHNPYFAAGMPTLLDAIAAAAMQQPTGTFEPKRTIEQGDLVAIHSHVKRSADDIGIAVVHIFRFEGDRIAEFWDVFALIPAESPNTDGMF